jgi:hypothetical protein
VSVCGGMPLLRAILFLGCSSHRLSHSLIMRREDKIAEEIQSRRESSSELLSQAVPSERRVLISQTPAANMNMQPAERARMTNCRRASGASVCALCIK